MGRIAADFYRRYLETGGTAVTADSMELASGLTAEMTLFNLLGIELPESRSGFYERIKRAQEFIFYCSRYPWNRMLTLWRSGRGILLSQSTPRITQNSANVTMGTSMLVGIPSLR